MMKKLHLSLLMLLIGVWAMASDTSVKNADGVEIWYNFDSITMTASVTSYKGESQYFYGYTGEVVIPSKVTYEWMEYSVTSIESYAFFGCSGLTSVTIPESVTEIGASAFSCTAIYKNESNWENNVLYIDNCLIHAKAELSGEYAIKEDTRLIANYAFEECSGLTSVTIPEGMTEIGSFAFFGFSGLTSVTIPEGVTEIGDYAFENCSGLISVTIPESVTKIGEGAFSGCSGLISMTCKACIPPRVNNAFSYKFDTSIPFYIPKESMNLYKKTESWGSFTNVHPIPINRSVIYSIGGVAIILLLVVIAFLYFRKKKNKQ